MAQVSPARRVAYEVLRRVHGGGFSDALLLDMAQPLAVRDAGLAHEIVYGVLRHQNQLDWLAQHFSGRQILTIDEPTAILLRMGLYQLRYLSRIPPHAAVMEAVELAKRASKRAAAGLVNAVLRKVHKKELKFPDAPTELCMPEWLYRKWLKSYGKEQTRSMALSFMQPPEKVNRAGYRMDSGAQTIVPLLESQPGQTLLDLCAAPGNKTRQAVDLGLKVISCDRSFKRLLPLQQIGVPLVHLDGSLPLPFRHPFDRVLADAPCSGTGTLGRNPEIKWRLTPEDLDRQQARQIGILREGLTALAPGGVLVYSTCSLEKEENEDVVRAVCGDSAIPMHYRIPGRDPGDGFFAAVIHKPA